jgi:serine/threonine protein phosphatase 1
MIYVMSDIHGHRRRFDSVMKQINLQPEDTLYILGDVIDRNPDGIRILQQLRAMPNVVMLLGNHEYMMLDALYNIPDEEDGYADYLREKRLNLWYRNGGDVTHRYLKQIRAPGDLRVSR